jgi:predicted dienelactone hydrolase
MKNQFVRLSAAALLFGAIFSPIAFAQHEQTQSYKKDAGALEVATVSYEWNDAKRNREVPVKIYYPKNGDGKSPVIIFSHGLGGTREGYEYLGRHWASHGYVSVHLQHIGSDDSAWRGQGAQIMQAMRQAAADPSNAINRPLDVRFAIDQMEKLNKQDDSPFKGRLDLENIGMAGHSFGAYTTLAVAGQTFVLPRGGEQQFADPRVKAAIAMSAPVPRNKEQRAKAFSSIKIPCLHMTGTEDTSPINDTTAEERLIPFQHAKLADAYLINFKGGDHMIFSGRGRMRAKPSDARFQELIRQSAIAFWDGYLKGDAKAKAWLAEGGFEKVMGADGTFEKKVKWKPGFWKF